jgi:YD repeat-containing protein
MPTATVAGVCRKCAVPFSDGSICPSCGNTPEAPALPTNGTLLQANLRGLLFAFLLAIAAFVYIEFTVLNSTIYTDSVQRALASPEVQSLIGKEIRVRQPALGYVSLLGDQKFAEWSVTLAGPRGRGHLYGVANRVRGAWEYSRLSFQADNAKDRARVDLTPVQRLKLPSVPSKSVFLLPMGLDDDQSLGWAHAYYKSKLGIEVTELPTIPLDPKLIDPASNQLNSIKCFDFLAETYPQIARDPFSILIAVTSHDLYIPGWRYNHNARSDSRYAVISSARLHPASMLEKLNPEWLTSRVEKLLTKNIAMLYFDLPLSSDYTSMLSGGIPSGAVIDRMGGDIIGAEGHWHSFIESNDPSTTIYDGPGDKQLWKLDHACCALPDTNSQLFSMGLGTGIILQSKADVVFEGDRPMQFTRIYRNQDDRSRSFGIGGSNSFDIFRGGQTGVAIDLIMEDGHRIHFNYHQPNQGETGPPYQVGWGGEDGRFHNATANFVGSSWEVKTEDGWTYIFPYKPQALPQNVTVLTGFIDPEGREYKMERDQFGSLISIKSPTGNWLRFENDAQHRIQKITSSLGRTMQYDYDAGGRMVRAEASDGHVDSYSFDDKSQMITASHATGKPGLTNAYSADGFLRSQTLADGRKFDYSYFRRERGITYESYITDPNGLQTYIQYVRGGYLQSLPTSVPSRRIADK